MKYSDLFKGSCKALANDCIKLRLESTFHLLIAKLSSLHTENKSSIKENKAAFK